MSRIQQHKTVQSKGRVGSECSEYPCRDKDIKPCILREDRGKGKQTKHNTDDKTTQEIDKEYPVGKGMRVMVRDIVVDQIA